MINTIPFDFLNSEQYYFSLFEGINNTPTLKNYFLLTSFATLWHGFLAFKTWYTYDSYLAGLEEVFAHLGSVESKGKDTVFLVKFDRGYFGPNIRAGNYPISNKLEDTIAIFKDMREFFIFDWVADESTEEAIKAGNKEIAEQIKQDNIRNRTKLLEEIENDYLHRVAANLRFLGFDEKMTIRGMHKSLVRYVNENPHFVHSCGVGELKDANGNFLIKMDDAGNPKLDENGEVIKITIGFFENSHNVVKEERDYINRWKYIFISFVMIASWFSCPELLVYEDIVLQFTLFSVTDMNQFLIKKMGHMFNIFDILNAKYAAEENNVPRVSLKEARLPREPKMFYEFYKRHAFSE